MFWQCSLLAIIALLGAEILTLIFYSIFFSDRLFLDLLLSGIIVLVVAYPLSYIFLTQSVRLMRMAEEIERRSRIDDLSQVLNRKSFLDAADDLLAASSSPSGAGTFLYLDIDWFKTINDERGHAMGDEVIRRMGALLQSCVRHGDIVGRLGGEEFGIFLPAGDDEDAAAVYSRIAQRAKEIGQELGLDDRHVSLSAGMISHRPGQGFNELMKLADKRLYRAKSKGRNRLISKDGPGLAA